MSDLIESLEKLSINNTNEPIKDTNVIKQQKQGNKQKYKEKQNKKKTEDDSKQKVPLYVSLTLEKSLTEELKNTLIKKLNDLNIDVEKYKVKRGLEDPAHVTLAFSSDFKPINTYVEFFTNNYLSKKDETFTVQVIGFGYDDHCVACMVELGDSELQFYPETKKLHITMMLNGKPPVYSNELLQRLKQENYEFKPNENLIFFTKDEIIPINTNLHFVGNLKY
jgi:hypothetical protein